MSIYVYFYEKVIFYMYGMVEEWIVVCWVDCWIVYIKVKLVLDDFD